MNPQTLTIAEAVPGTRDSRPPLVARELDLSYDQRRIVSGLDLEIPAGQFSVIVGPNACGKSTLLRALARLLPPTNGSVLLDGQDIARMRTKQIAKRLGLLPQSSIAPEGITVGELVSRGRHPHQSFLRQWTDEDEAAVLAALRATNTETLSSRPVDELSGGQRQRVWVAMVLAQETPLLLLDEPTTFLDVAFQIDLLDLFAQLNHDHGHTLVAVLHDLNQACRYADSIIAMKDGVVVAQGAPDQIVTADLVRDVFGIDCTVIADPVTGAPMIVPGMPRKTASARQGAAARTTPAETNPTARKDTEE
ncbi:iron complex transport system ATP-binding protein [Brevibacterium sanguinis]|uniref:Iron complex transport system ATP-binding protein n=2 Tax=Brevibacterium TaxID=1696 RepID=A0A366IKF6_9MICO|nr:MULTISPECIES: ABC transporter ATP-binding protein [Brevibacterium]RBP66241.1 iron complex transport system ATP-binding protein [Brevibacterium sanguinis]RBP72892.1 iron complex transport system ATP-binding protein [Brevibacterium celere]